jgi:hypothetical protein
MKKKSNMIPPKVCNSTIMDTNDSEVDETPENNSK